MMHKMIRIATSTLVIGAMTAGCSSVSMVRPAVVADSKGDQRAAGYYREAQEQMKRGDIANATEQMEDAVEQSPRDVGYRIALAELYLKSGRFASAETTFADAIAIRPDDSRAGFYLAVSQIAQGKTQAAIEQLRGMDPTSAPADIGLAYALAGDTHRALALLEPAASAPTANGRVRQNLALAYALSGDWKKARLVASQDVSPSELGKRMQQWAALATPSASAVRVASLLGVTPVENDVGQPARLALQSSGPQSIEAASADPIAVPNAPVETPAIASASVAAPAPVTEAAPVVVVASVPSASPVVPVAAPEPTPVAPAYAEAVKTLIDPAPSEARRIIRATATTFSRPKAQNRKAGAGRYVVQLGAFRSSAQVERAWAQSTRRFAFNQGQQPVSTTVNIPGKGLFHRLSVSGFENPVPAQQLCRSIKARGGICFVRTLAGDAPVQWASRYTRKA